MLNFIKRLFLHFLRWYNILEKVGDKMAKKKQKRAKKKALRFFVFGIACITLITIIILSFSKLWVQIYEKYKEKKELETKLKNLKEKEQDLEIDVEKMQDPEYVGRYLREKYYYSKDGEYILRIPEKYAILWAESWFP